MGLYGFLFDILGIGFIVVIILVLWKIYLGKRQWVSAGPI